MPQQYDFGDSDSPSSATPETDKYRKEAQDYLNEVSKYVPKAQAKSFRKVDPTQFAFSEEAEVLRQTGKKEGVFPQGTPRSSTIASRDEQFETDTSGQTFAFDDTEPKSTQRSYSENLSRNLPESLIAKRTRPGVSQALDPLFQGAIAPLAAGLDTVLGGNPREVTDKVFGPPSTDWRSNIIPGIMEAALGVLPAAPLMAVGAGRGAAARPGAGTPTPAVLSRGELDATVSHRSLAKSAIETGAFPDSDLVPLRRVPTGNTLTVPSMDTPLLEHTGEQLGGVTRQAKGQFGRSAYPDLLPGEMREGQQNLPIGAGYPAEGAPTGKYILTPEEQVPQGMDILRPQVVSKGAQSAQSQQAYSDFASNALKSRILTPEMLRTLETPPELRGGAPVTVKPSKSGLSASIEPNINEPFKLPGEFTTANTADGAVFPNLYTRISGSVTDVMRRTGPLGNGIADYVDSAYANRARITSSQMLEATQAYDSIFGKTTRIGRAKTMFKQLAAGENAFLNGSAKEWGISEKTQEEIFNYMYSGGKRKPVDPKAAAAGDALYQKLTYPTSSDPGVRTLHLTNPFTGKPQPLGEPNMFMPQQPVHPITATAIGDAQWNILYNRAGGEKLGVSLDTYKKTIIKLSQHDPEVTAHKMKGLENMRLLDLEALGGSPYQWAKKLGYETDPYRAAFKFNSMGTLRGQLAQIEGPVNELLMRIPAEASDAGKWLHLATDRAMLNPGKFDSLGTTTNTLKGISHMLDVTMLQQGGLANMAQASFVAARGGARATMKGAFDLLTGRDKDIIARSGASFPALLNEMTNPTGPMATFSSGAFRLYGLSFVDRATRYFAGHVGNRLIQQLEGSFLKNPQSQRLQRSLSELGIDPKALLQQGSISDTQRLSAIQRFANHTSGVTDVRGTPLWASTENPWARLVNKYRTFAVANSAEMRRLVVNAPSAYDAAKRVSTLLAGAYVVGGGINEARKWLHDSLMGNEAKPTKEGVMRHAERLMQGLGTIEGMFMVNAAKDPFRAMAGFTGGPAGGVTASFLQDMIATAEHGFGWRSVDTLSKRIPLVGPVIGPLVGAEVKKESRETRANRDDSGY